MGFNLAFKRLRTDEKYDAKWYHGWKGLMAKNFRGDTFV
jgi:hypothetical protein